VTKKRAVPRHHRLGYRVPEFLLRLWQKSVEDEVFFMAGAIAFNVLIALVPLLILGIGLTGFVLSARFGDPTDVVLALVADNLPQAGEGVALVEAFRAPVSSLVERRTGFTVFGALFLVWVSTRLVATLRIALREIFDLGRQRGVLMGKLFDIQAVLIGVSLLTLNLGVTVAFEATMDYGIGLIGVDGSTFSIIERLLGHGLALGSIWTLFLIA